MIHFCCVSSHASDQWMCQWVFPAQMSSCSERHQYCGIWTLHHLLEEVTAPNILSLSACILHASDDFPFLMLMSYKPFYIKNVKVYTFITCLNKYSLTNYKSTVFNYLYNIFFLSRKSAFAETSVVRTIIILPHVMVENIPLYVHAGQSVFILKSVVYIESSETVLCAFFVL